MQHTTNIDPTVEDEQTAEVDELLMQAEEELAAQHNAPPSASSGPSIAAPRPTEGHDTVAILDFGSQYTQLIARRVRELGVYSEILPCDAPESVVAQLHPRAYILSGGPASVYEPGAPTLPPYVL